MSMYSLPTELNDLIVGFLDRQGLDAVSKVSKYYREIAEPILYRVICFEADRNIQARRLLLTLLSRPLLATYIKRLSVQQGFYPISGQTMWNNDTEERLENDQTAIRRTITSIVGSGSTAAGVRMKWQGSIFSEDYIEGTAVLVACMAPNIEVLDFRVDDRAVNPTCGSFFSRLLTEAVRLSTNRGPRLSKLDVLVLQSETHIDVPDLPSLQFLTIVGCKSIAYPDTREKALYQPTSAASIWIAPFQRFFCPPLSLALN